MRIAFLFVLPIVVAASGCQSDPWAWQYARTKPTQSLVGVYVPTAQTSTFLASRYKNVKSSQLDIRADSSFTLRNVAHMWSGFPSPGGFETAKGRWSVGKHQDWWALKLAVHSILQTDGQLNKTQMDNSALLVGQRGPYIIHFTIGDPDTGEALQYERR